MRLFIASERTVTTESKKVIGYMCDLCGDHIKLNHPRGRLYFDDLADSNKWLQADFCPGCFNKFRGIFEALGGKFCSV